MNNVNRTVEVTALSFRSKPREQQLESYPRRMVYEGREYTFIELGMHYLVQSGKQLIKLFDVSDGDQQFRLRLEGDRWTLVGIKGLAINRGGHYANV